MNKDLPLPQRQELLNRIILEMPPGEWGRTEFVRCLLREVLTDDQLLKALEIVRRRRKGG